MRPQDRFAKSVGIGTGLSYAAAASYLSTPWWGTAIAMAGAPILGYAAYRGVRWFSPLDRKVHQLRMGGDSDSLTSQAYRKKAVQEISNSVSDARQFLGREALLMRQ